MYTKFKIIPGEIYSHLKQDFLLKQTEGAERGCAVDNTHIESCANTVS